MDKKQISERPCDYQHYKGISTGEWEPSIPRQFVIWMKGRKKRMLSTVYFDYSLLATPWSPTLPSHITCGAPALQAPSLGQPTRAATPSVTSGQSTHCGSLPSIWRGMLSRRDRNRAKKTSFHLHEMWLARSWNALSKPVHPKKQSLCIQKYQRPATSGGSPKGTDENQIPRSRKAKPRMGTTWEPDL